MRGLDVTLKRAKALRREMSPPEVRLWLRIRRRIEGHPNWRQHPMGHYILDFYCSAGKLCVEVDGSSHSLDERANRDERRDHWLEAQGVEVMRIPARSVYEDVDAVAEWIRIAALERVGRC